MTHVIIYFTLEQLAGYVDQARYNLYILLYSSIAIYIIRIRHQDSSSGFVLVYAFMANYVMIS